jgi:hypothetical protein
MHAQPQPLYQMHTQLSAQPQHQQMLMHHHAMLQPQPMAGQQPSAQLHTLHSQQQPMFSPYAQPPSPPSHSALPHGQASPSLQTLVSNGASGVVSYPVSAAALQPMAGAPPAAQDAKERDQKPPGEVKMSVRVLVRSPAYRSALCCSAPLLAP